MDDRTVAVGSGVGSRASIGHGSFDGPVGSGTDSADSWAGDSATRLGIIYSGLAAVIWSLT